MSDRRSRRHGGASEPDKSDRQQRAALCLERQLLHQEPFERHRPNQHQAKSGDTLHGSRQAEEQLVLEHPALAGFLRRFSDDLCGLRHGLQAGHALFQAVLRLGEDPPVPKHWLFHQSAHGLCCLYHPCQLYYCHAWIYLRLGFQLKALWIYVLGPYRLRWKRVRGTLGLPCVSIHVLRLHKKPNQVSHLA